VSPTAPIAQHSLDQLAERVIASGDPSLCARLVLTIHGRDALRAARRLAERFAERFPGDAQLAQVRDLVAPPKVVPTAPIERVDRRANLAWVREHAAEYPGEWLVLSRGRLWAHSPSLPEAQAGAREAGFVRTPAPSPR
jgi:hypothetical protein